jgi:hypothetical protein
MRAILFALTVLAAGLALAAEPPVSLKGVSIGMKLPQVRAMFPSLAQDPKKADIFSADTTLDNEPATLSVTVKGGTISQFAFLLTSHEHPLDTVVADMKSKFGNNGFVCSSSTDCQKRLGSQVLKYSTLSVGDPVNAASGAYMALVIFTVAPISSDL